ncbi:Pkinase-domain-containing protein [Marasmius fiardii PR-910]|nr:Pkinase-domain-containing protein [Marasmius fiardii PR-910]
MSNAHKHSGSISQNQKAQLANAYNELGKELSSSKLRVIGNYTLGRVIGEGAYGTVRIGTHRLTSTRVAIKQIPKELSASLTREIHHHRQLHHPHITQMYEVIATEKSIWIVTELCSGGELFDYLAEKGRLTEDEARFLFGQLCLAVAHLHEKGIVHRDLKLENVLLDERCRVKLGDFGFTREYERGALMETFCGTTGYAAPEMLQCERYLGPEVDIWSLGVILYCLLTGMLPFDDDDEAVMREKVIVGEFGDPEWLSDDVRDLIKRILVKNPSKRISISQILAHPWFSARKAGNVIERPPRKSSLPISPDERGPSPSNASNPSATSSDLSSNESSKPGSSAPTTPTRSFDDPFEMPNSSAEKNSSNTVPTIHPNPSETTLRKEPRGLDNKLPITDSKQIMRSEILEEEEAREPEDDPNTLHRQRTNSSDSRSLAPPVHTLRTPARTKRRSVSSTMSDPDNDYDPPPILLGDTNNSAIQIINSNSNNSKNSHFNLPASNQRDRDVDFASLLNTPSPIIFSTSLERELLNIMNALGFDLGQIVYSVLNNACDSSGAVWWMLKRKAEKKMLSGEDVFSWGEGKDSKEVDAYIRQSSPSSAPESSHSKAKGKEKDAHHPKHRHHKKHTLNAAVQVDLPTTPTSPVPPPVPEKSFLFTPTPLNLQKDGAPAPSLAVVPATPTFPPPRATTPPNHVGSPMLTPSSSAAVLGSDSSGARSHPSTPSAAGSGFSASGVGVKGRKNRAGSVSIMQRATTALEAAGLVRKKSSEAVKEEKEKERERSKETERERKTGGEELPPPPRSSHGSSSSGGHKLTKSPPLRASRGPSTPPPLTEHPQLPAIGSPWVLAESSESLGAHSTQSQAHSNPHYVKRTAITPANSPAVEDGGDIFTSVSQPNLGEGSNSKGSTGSNSGRNRANILSAFRLWFQEDRKGKRKEGNHIPSLSFGNKGSSRISGNNANRTTGNGLENVAPPHRRMSGSRSSGGFRGGKRRNRPSISSRRSSSVNSRRSSVASVQMVILAESPQVPRRSIGSYTPNSERGEYSSRPSSIRSVSRQPRHRKSPSASSTGSLSRSQSLNRASSPMKYHRRGGSGSSTRVVRQGPKPLHHGRSNSTASSVHHSPASSRPTSFIEYSDYEGQRTASPFKSRRSSDEMSTPRKHSRDTTSTFVAHKRGAPFSSSLTGYNSLGKSSWKKSWGLEPPGWQTRTAHLPVEVLAVSPAEGSSIRDVFSGRQSLNLGDESDWVDEDDDIPYAGGLGQMGFTSSASSSMNSKAGILKSKNGPLESTPIINPPVSRRAGSGGGSKRSETKKAGHTPVERVSPSPTESHELESRGGRRQLPAGRSGPAFKQPIQEEEEEEE